MAVSPDDILALYPQYEFLLNHPEIGDKLREGAEKGWDAVKLEQELHGTKWWKTTWPSMRRWMAIKEVDPGGAKYERQQADYEVRSTLRRLGVTASDLEVRFISEEWLRHGKDEWFLLSTTREWLRRNPGRVNLRAGGELQASVGKIKEMAGQYFVNIDDQTARSWALDQWSGNKSEEFFQSFFVQQAKNRWASLAPFLDRGVTVREYFSPVINAVAQELELSPEQVDPMNPRFAPLVSAVDKDGLGRFMTENEARQWARSQDDWQYTSGSMEQASRLGSVMLERMGQIA